MPTREHFANSSGCEGRSLRRDSAGRSCAVVASPEGQQDPVEYDLQEFQHIRARGTDRGTLLLDGAEDGAWDSEQHHFPTGGQERAATDSNSSQVRLIADDEERVNFRIVLKPSGNRCDLRKSAKPPGQNRRYLNFPMLKKDEKVPLWRRHVSRQFQEIERNRQRHF